MNQKVTLPKASRLMSEATGISVRQCEDFLKALADVVTESLSEGEQVRIKGLGTFRLTNVEPRRSVDVTSGEPTEIAGHTKVVFVPCKEMAAEVNSPFGFFEAVELDEAVSEEELEAVEDMDSEELAVSEIESATKESVLNEPTVLEEEPEDFIEEETQSEPEMSESLSDNGEVENEPTVKEETALEDNVTVRAESERETSLSSKDVETEKRHRFGKGFIVGVAVCLLAVAVGMGVGFALVWGKLIHGSVETETLVSKNVVKPSEDRPLAVDTISDSIDEVAADHAGVSSEDIPTSPSDETEKSGPVYDTIGKTRYLTTMAKEHYGDFNLWPYIYEENKAILGHPDRIRPGTKVVIPPLSKYNVTNSPADIAKAKRLGAEIYSRYK